MTPKTILEQALERCSADEANEVALFPAYNRLKIACEKALEGLREVAEPKPVSLPREPHSVYGREVCELIICASAFIGGIRPIDIVGQRRTKLYAMHRAAAIWVVRHKTALTMVDIGAIFGGRDHSTVLYSLNAVDADKISGGERWRIVRAVESKLWPEAKS
jgi:hypothetical protein